MRQKTRSAEGKALFQLGMEIIHTYFRLRAAGAKIGASPPAGAGSFGLLRSLLADGPQTVPQLARGRQVARQHIQSIANDLAKLKLIEFVENPAHKRSKLVQITGKGETELRDLTLRIEDAYEEIAAGMDAGEIDMAVKVLSQLRRRVSEK